MIVQDITKPLVILPDNAGDVVTETNELVYLDDATKIATQINELADVTVDNAKEILKDIISSEINHIPLSIDKIQEVVAQHYHIHVKDLKSKKKWQ